MTKKSLKLSQETTFWNELIGERIFQSRFCKTFTISTLTLIGKTIL